MAKYRPEGWKNPFMYYEGLYSSRSLEIESNEHYSIYEAGADAMLSALKGNKHAAVLFVPANHFLTSIPIIMPGNGCWVFIPDDEKIA